MEDWCNREAFHSPAPCITPPSTMRGAKGPDHNQESGPMSWLGSKTFTASCRQLSLAWVIYLYRLSVYLRNSEEHDFCVVHKCLRYLWSPVTLCPRNVINLISVLAFTKLVASIRYVSFVSFFNSFAVWPHLHTLHLKSHILAEWAIIPNVINFGEGMWKPVLSKWLPWRWHKEL